MSPQQLLQTAAHHHQNGRLDEAEKIYRQLLAANENDPEALHLLGLLLSQRGDPTTGRALISRAIALLPNSELFHINYASLSAACGFPEEAVKSFLKAIELNRNTPAIVYAQLGQTLASLNRDAEAVYALEWAMKLQPYADWLLLLSQILERLGRHQEASDRLNQAIQMNPNITKARPNP